MNAHSGLLLLFDAFGYDYGALGRLGEAGLQAVTTSMSINYLSRPRPGEPTSLGWENSIE